MTAVFADAGYLIAMDYLPDQYHAAAVAHWNRFLRNPRELVTTSFVLSEVVAFFVSRGRHAKALDIVRRVMSSGRVRLVHVDEELFTAAVDYLERRPDKRFSLTDCISFVLMNRLGIHEALAFDAHFEQAGFTRLPLLP